MPIPGIKKLMLAHPIPPINENIEDTDGNTSAMVDVTINTTSDIITFLVISLLYR